MPVCSAAGGARCRRGRPYRKPSVMAAALPDGLSRLHSTSQEQEQHARARMSHARAVCLVTVRLAPVRARARPCGHMVAHHHLGLCARGQTLSALSQASMIHVNDPKFDHHLFRENINMHTSTSPQYNIIASLDVARRQASSADVHVAMSMWLRLVGETGEAPRNNQQVDAVVTNHLARCCAR